MPTESELVEMFAAEEAVELGKVVFLRSGGPPMTVRSLKSGKVTCEWFDKSDRYRSQEFLVYSLIGRKPSKDGMPRGLLVIGNLDPEEPDKK